MKQIVWFFTVIIVLLMSGCDSGKRATPDVSSIKVDVNVYPFIFDFLSIHADSIDQYLPALKNKYPTFLDLYSQGVLRIGSIEEADYNANLYKFLSIPHNPEVLQKCDSVFNDIDQIKEEFDEVFKYYKHYFPSKIIPEIYLQTSGFNQSMVVDSGLVAVSLEKYLGQDCEFYELLRNPMYIRKKMNPEKLVPDVIKALAYTEFSYEDSIDDVFTNMYYHARVLYMVKSVVPELNDTLLFDYSAKELKWAQEYEADCWAGMIEQRHLYSTDRMTIKKYTGDSPFTAFFGQDSPPRVAVYIGYRIIEAFMNRNKDVSLNQLMMMNDSRKILLKSAYRP